MFIWIFYPHKEQKVIYHCIYNSFISLHRNKGKRHTSSFIFPPRFFFLINHRQGEEKLSIRLLIIQIVLNSKHDVYYIARFGKRARSSFPNFLCHQCAPSWICLFWCQNDTVDRQAAYSVTSWVELQTSNLVHFLKGAWNGWLDQTTFVNIINIACRLRFVTVKLNASNVIRMKTCVDIDIEHFWRKNMILKILRVRSFIQIIVLSCCFIFI